MTELYLRNSAGRHAEMRKYSPIDEDVESAQYSVLSPWFLAVRRQVVKESKPSKRARGTEGRHAAIHRQNYQATPSLTE